MGFINSIRNGISQFRNQQFQNLRRTELERQIRHQQLYPNTSLPPRQFQNQAPRFNESAGGYPVGYPSQPFLTTHRLTFMGSGQNILGTHRRWGTVGL